MDLSPLWPNEKGGKQLVKRFLSVLFLLTLTVAGAACGGVSIHTHSSASPAPVQSGAAEADTSTAPQVQTVSIEFPAYTEPNPAQLPAVERINSAAKFQVELALPAGWTVGQTPPRDAVPIPGDFYTTLFICSGDGPIGYIGFNVFEPFDGDIPQEEYYKAVYPGLRLSSFFHWDPYTAVKTTDTAETGVAEIWYLDPNRQAPWRDAGRPPSGNVWRAFLRQAAARLYRNCICAGRPGPRAGTGNRRKRHTVSDWINTLAVPQTPNI